MKILSIGNSFSEDSTRYIYDIARADGQNIKVANLYIGGCSLHEHFKNIMTDAAEYDFQINGHSTKIYTSIKTALLSEQWDYITLQQVSRQSVDFDTFQPYLDELLAYVRKYAPNSKQIIHQTWAYKPECELMDIMGYACHQDMFKAVEASYKKAADAIGCDVIIPSGALVNLLVKEGVENLHRDSIHLSCGKGRYALGLLWYKFLTGNPIDNNTFCDFDEPVTKEEIEIIKKCVNQIV